MDNHMDMTVFRTRNFQEISESFKAIDIDIGRHMQKDHRPEYILSIGFNKILGEGVFRLKYGRPGKTQHGSFETLSFSFKKEEE